ncbi:MAG: pyridoxal-phosphate dependent enzyme [Candidatus Obscuribacterales bacterium]|nr:pyridoxal-phosphate dependent enzyme [Candidatus Obscuribacterales bacterium]
MLIQNITQAIGRTPLLEIDPAVSGLKNIRLFAKLENLNPFGSLKDRPALNLLSGELAGIKTQSKTVIESSSGNMAKAMTLICSMNDIPFRIVTNKVQVKEVKLILQLLGAQIDEFPGLSACPDPTDPNNPLAYIERVMAASPGQYFHASQFTNQKNSQAHADTTGPEIFTDAGVMDFLFAGLGTSGSSRGVGQFLKEKNPQLKTIGVVAPKGQHLPGIRSADEMFEVGLFERDFYEQIVESTTNEAIDAMLVLIRKLGVMSGPTGGAQFAAALKYLKSIDGALTEKKNAVFIVCDRTEWYLSFLQKHRPELFELAKRKESVRTVTDNEAKAAPSLSVAEADKWMADSKALVVIDLRGSLAFKAGHVPGSINMPAEGLEDLSEWGVPFSNNHRVLFICPQGDQSRKFAAFFKARGIDCVSLKGGFIAWRDGGKATERSVIKPASKP